MKKILHIILFILTAISANSQTTLLPGDIAILLNQTDNPDDFAFVTFVDLDPSTVIYFSDCGANDSGFNSPVCTEGAFAYTVPSGGHSLGEIIKFNSGANSNFSIYNDSKITGTFSGSFAGDQIVVFQDAASPGGSINAGENPMFIFISNTASTDFTGDIADSNQTGLPEGLQNTTPPITAMGLGSGSGVEDEWDNVVYIGSYTFNNISEAKLAITDINNYYKTNENVGLDFLYNDAVTNIPPALTITTLSLDELDLFNSIRVFPNPSHGIINISNPSELSLSEIKVIDLKGRLIANLQLKSREINHQFNLSDILEAGFYTLRIEMENASIVKKLIIQ